MRPLLSKQNAVVSASGLSRNIVDLKAAALLFDSIVITDDREDGAEQALSALFPQDWQFLCEHELVRFESYTLSPYGDDSIDASIRAVESAVRAGVCTAILLGPEDGEPHLRYRDNALARLTALRLATKYPDASLIPIGFGPEYDLDKLTGAEFFEDRAQNDLSYEPAIEAVFRKIPVPSDMTPWEDIIAFRADQKSRLLLFQFRRWVEQALLSCHPKDLESIVELELNNFRKSLEQHRIEVRSKWLTAAITMITSAMTTPLNLVGGLMGFSDTTVATFGAELKLSQEGPYYMVHAERRFRS